MDGRKRVAWNLRRIRVERDLSQESLAVDAGVDRSYISGIERESFNATVDVLDRLALALNVDLTALFAPVNENAEAPKPMKNGRRATRPARKSATVGRGIE